MDNASYHSKLVGPLFTIFLFLCFVDLSIFLQGDDIPRKNNKNWRKAQLVEWLEQKNFPFEDRNYTVKELWEIITPMIETANVYTAERIMEKYGVKCLRLPPYHPEFNPSKFAISVVCLQFT